MVHIKKSQKLLTRWVSLFRILAICSTIAERSTITITNKSKEWLNLSFTQNSSSLKQLKASSLMELIFSKMSENLSTITEWDTSWIQVNTLDRLQLCSFTERHRWLNTRNFSSISITTGKHSSTRSITRKMIRCINSRR